MILIKLAHQPSYFPKVYQIVANTPTKRAAKYGHLIFKTAWDIAIHSLYGIIQ